MKKYEEKYQTMTRWLRKSSKRKRELNFINRLLTYLFYISYPCLLLVLVITSNKDFIKSLLIPAVSFGVITVIRKVVNRPRPYEKWNIQPLIIKNTKGKSWPSRHVFSAAVIAVVFLYFNRPVGIIFLILAFLSGVVRILGGVHYLSDVVSGYIFGLLSGLFMWFL